MWTRQYNQFYCQDDAEIWSTPNTISVSVGEPVALTEIIVSALSTDAYKAASDRQSVLEVWFNDRRLILRQGDIHIFRQHASELQYRLDMVEPLMQGYAQLGKTRMIITLSGSPENASNAQSSDQEGFEIDEGFLASSLMPKSFHISSAQSMFPHDVDSQERSPEQFITRPLLVARSALFDHCTLYLRTADLGCLGVLNGDWVRWLSCYFYYF